MVMVMVMNDLLPPPLFNANRPSHSKIQLFQNLTMKIHGQGHVCGQMSRSHLTMKIQRSKSRPRSNRMVTFAVRLTVPLCWHVSAHADICADTFRCRHVPTCVKMCRHSECLRNQSFWPYSGADIWDMLACVNTGKHADMCRHVLTCVNWWH